MFFETESRIKMTPEILPKRRTKNLERRSAALPTQGASCTAYRLLMAAYYTKLKIAQERNQEQTGGSYTKRNPEEVSFLGVRGTGNDLLSHNLEMYYHRRTRVSLPCSVWERVGPCF